MVFTSFSRPETNRSRSYRNIHFQQDTNIWDVVGRGFLYGRAARILLTGLPYPSRWLMSDEPVGICKFVPILGPPPKEGAKECHVHGQDV